MTQTIRTIRIATQGPAGPAGPPGESSVTSVAGRTGAVTLTKADVGLGNVPNVDATLAGNIASGTLADARLSSNVPLRNVANTWSAANTFNFNTASAPTNAGGSVVQLVGADAAVARVETDSFGASASFSARRANGTGASPSALVVNDQIGALNYHGYYVSGGAGYSGAQASVQGVATQSWTATAQGTKLVLATTPNNTVTLTPALTLDQDQSATFAGAITNAGSFTLGSNSVFGNGTNMRLWNGGGFGWTNAGNATSGTFDTALFRGAAGLVGFGGATSSFPGLKRSSTTLQARLADDSAFTKIQGQLQTHANAVAETITPDKTIIIYDAAGQAYRVPCTI